MGPMGNVDVPLNAPPGNYIRFDPKGTNPGNQDRRLSGRYRMNVVATMGSDASADVAPDVPILVAGELDALQKFGKRSGARRLVARILAQQPWGLDIYVTPIRMSGGAAAVVNLTIVLIGAATAATSSGQIRVRVCDHEAVVDVAVGDTPAVIATNLRARMIAQLTPATGPGAAQPFTIGALVGTTQIPLTYATTGVHGNDHPFIATVDQALAASIGVSFGEETDGSILFANGPTGGAAGVVTVKMGTKTVVASGIAATTADEDVCAAVAAAINLAGDFPCFAQQRAAPNDDRLDLIMKPGRVCHRLSVTVNANIGPMTATPQAETAGSGTPSLTAALANLTTADAAAEWVTEFNDATSLGLLATHIRSMGNGYVQKEQHLTFGASLGLTDSGAVVSGVTPTLLFEDNLLSSPGRFTCFWVGDAAQPAADLAAHRAALRAIQQRPTANLNGAEIRSLNPAMPLTYPHPAVRPDPFSTTGQARKTYFMTPGIVKDGVFVVEADTTTYGGTLPGWSTSEYAHGAANYRQELLAGLATLRGKETVVNSEPYVDEVIDEESIKDNILATNRRLEKQNLYDGASVTARQITAIRDPRNPQWWLVGAPFILPQRLDVIAGTAYPAG